MISAYHVKISHVNCNACDCVYEIRLQSIEHCSILCKRISYAHRYNEEATGNRFHKRSVFAPFVRIASSPSGQRLTLSEWQTCLTRKNTVLAYALLDPRAPRVSDLFRYMFGLWLVVCSAPIHHMNQYWLVVNWNLRNNFSDALI